MNQQLFAYYKFVHAVGLCAMLWLTGCNSNSGSNSTPSDVIHQGNQNIPLTKVNCVNVYVEKNKNSNYPGLAAGYAVNVLNLLGHFPDYQRHLSAIEDYRKGDLQKCAANIFLDTNYYSSLPSEFIEDFVSTDTQVAWVGENSWKLGSAGAEIFGVKHHYPDGYTTLDTTNLVDGKPSFFKNVSYKGKVFPKYGEFGKYDSNKAEFFSAYEIAKFDFDVSWILDSSDFQVISEVEHNFTHEKLKWALRNKNKFLIAEIPLSFVHSADRYYIFADLLFDILKAPARRSDHYAIIRLEDVHSETSVNSLNRARQIFKVNGITPQVSIIPVYKNPTNPNMPYIGLAERTINDNAAFMTEINAFKNDGANFIWHGITHQLGNRPNPWESTTASDYEFWDFSEDLAKGLSFPLIGRPVPGESSESILTLFRKGADALDAAGIFPTVWLTPHYHGSSLSNYIFGQLFEWNIGRVVYYKNSMSGLQLSVAAHEVKFNGNANTEEQWSARIKYLQNLKVDQDTRQNGQVFPYEIYGDVYGQRLFPENLGNVEKVLIPDQVIETRDVSQILSDAERNLVLRDSWGSAFFHPYYLEGSYWSAANSISKNELHDLLFGLKNNLGYKFIDLKSLTQEWKDLRAKPVSYRY